MSTLHVLFTSSIIAVNVWTIVPFESFITTITSTASASTVPVISGVSSLVWDKSLIVISAAVVSTSISCIFEFEFNPTSSLDVATTV